MAILPFLIEYQKEYENFKNEKIIDFMTVLYNYLMECHTASLGFNTFSNQPFKTNHKIYSENYYYYLFLLENIGRLNSRELHKFISHLNFVDDKYVLVGWSFDYLKHHLKTCINYDFRGKQMDLF